MEGNLKEITVCTIGGQRPTSLEESTDIQYHVFILFQILPGEERFLVAIYMRLQTL